MTMPTSQLPRPDAEGNYDSPPLRALRQVWSDFLQDKASEVQVMDTIAELGRFAQHNLGLMEGTLESGESNPEDPGFCLIMEAFELVLEGCEHMALEFVDPDPEDQVEEPEEGFFAFGLALVQEATNQMMEGHRRTMEHIAATAQVSCPFCAQPNSRELPRCAKCGRALPQSEAGGQTFNAVQEEGLEGGAASQGEVTENYVLLARAVAGWKSGNVSQHDLAGLIEEVEGKLIAHLQDTARQEEILQRAPAERRPALARAVALTREGLDASLAALERMKMAFEKEDGGYLEVGLSDLEQASMLMVASFKASKSAAGAG
jgi:hypothetical protein